MPDEQIIKVGIGVMVMKEGRVLMGKRKGSHGAGEYSFSGGHLEYMESIEDCARRETREEAGIEIKNIQFSFLSNLKTYVPKHYIHIGLIADWLSDEPAVLEPDKCESWQWLTPEEALKFSLFEPCRLSFKALKSGKVFLDS